MDKFFDLFPSLDFSVGMLPFTDYPSILGVAFGYLVVVYLLKDYMKNKKSYNLKWTIAVHNLFLCGLSVLMLVGVIYEL